MRQLTPPKCVLPGCATVVQDEGQPCDRCRVAFGDYLAVNPEGTPLTAAEVADRDHTVRAILRDRHPRTSDPGPEGRRSDPPKLTGPERKRNQMCWLCEERHSCARTPQGWECDACRAIA